MLVNATFERREPLVERLTPAFAILFGLGVWLVLVAIAPVEPRWPQDLYPVSLFLFCTVGLFAGILAPDILRVDFEPVTVDEGVFRTYFRLILVLATIGLAAKMIDTFVFRGISLDASAAEREMSLKVAQSGPFSLIAAMLLPLGQAALLLAAIGKRLGLLRQISPSALAVTLFNPLLQAALGSRSTLFLFAVEGLIAAVLLFPTIKVKHIAIAGALGLILTVVSSYIFAMRLEMSGMDYRFSVRHSVYTITVPATAGYLTLLDETHGTVGPLLAATVSLLQYFIHGVFEFFYLVELKSDNFTDGDTIFFFVSKLLSYVTGDSTALSALEIESRNPRSGTFQSFFGPIYIDFGPLSVLFCFAFGVFTTVVRRVVQSGNVFAFPLYVFLLMNLVILPCVSGLLMFAGSITLMIYIALWPLGGILQKLRS